MFPTLARGAFHPYILGRSKTKGSHEENMILFTCVENNCKNDGNHTKSFKTYLWMHFNDNLLLHKGVLLIETLVHQKFQQADLLVQR